MSKSKRVSPVLSGYKTDIFERINRTKLSQRIITRPISHDHWRSPFVTGLISRAYWTSPFVVRRHPLWLFMLPLKVVLANSVNILGGLHRMNNHCSNICIFILTSAAIGWKKHVLFTKRILLMEVVSDPESYFTRSPLGDALIRKIAIAIWGVRSNTVKL